MLCGLPASKATCRGCCSAARGVGSPMLPPAPAATRPPAGGRRATAARRRGSAGAPSRSASTRCGCPGRGAACSCCWRCRTCGDGGPGRAAGTSEGSTCGACARCWRRRRRVQRALPGAWRSAPLLELGHAVVLLPQIQENGGQPHAVLGGLGQDKVQASSHPVVQLACGMASQQGRRLQRAAREPHWPAGCNAEPPRNLRGTAPRRRRTWRRHQHGAAVVAGHEKAQQVEAGGLGLLELARYVIGIAQRAVQQRPSVPACGRRRPGARVVWGPAQRALRRRPAGTGGSGGAAPANRNTSQVASSTKRPSMTRMKPCWGMGRREGCWRARR